MFLQSVGHRDMTTEEELLMFVNKTQTLNSTLPNTGQYTQ